VTGFKTSSAGVASLSSETPAPVVEARAISKRFGPTIALQDARIRVEPGRTHGLVGRNGAGKSTLISLLTGRLKPDSGSILFSGRPSPPLSEPRAWQSLVACVYQHSTIIPDLSVAENLFVHRQPTTRGWIDWPRMRREARNLLDVWGVDVPVEVNARELTVEERQLVEIARALSRGTRFVILDEPTAQLDGAEIWRLFDKIRELQARGVTFLFISHHLQEVYEICQDVTVLRDARHIVSAPVADLPKANLIAAMTGESHIAEGLDAARRARPANVETVAEIRALRGPLFQDISLAVRRGEIIGVTGASSSGRTELCEAAAGLGPFTEGEIRVNGAALAPADVPRALKLGVGCVPKNRHREGLVLGQSIAENITMPVMGKLGPLGWIDLQRRRLNASEAMDRLGVVANAPEQPVSDLSGGNQQKVVFARALAGDPTFLVLIDPTAGVDVKSKTALLAQVEALRAQGRGILLSSSEIEDLRICDRVHVMRRGAVASTFEPGWDEADLLASIEGLQE
jgi:simple sugar transport system ATP-binding protein